MAVSLLSHEVSDLCLGKPALRSLPISATVGEALSALKRCGESYLTVWSCDRASKNIEGCRCVGKVCMVDVICFLCQTENLSDPITALASPVSVLLHGVPAPVVQHVEPNTSLLEGLDLILDGTQNLIVPIQTRGGSNGSRKKLWKSVSVCNNTHANGREFCWVSQEDVVRYLFNSIGVFSPLPSISVHSLGLIQTDVLTIGYNEPASSAVNAIGLALTQQTSIAVISPDGKLIGEISPSTLIACNESAAAAIVTLSAGDLMAYIDCGGPPSSLVSAVKARLRERDMEGMLELLDKNTRNLRKEKKREMEYLLAAVQAAASTFSPHFEGNNIACVTLMLLCPLAAVLLLIMLQRHCGLELITDFKGLQQSLDGLFPVELR